MIIRLSIILLFVIGQCVSEFDLEVENGRTQYEMVSRDSKMPKYGTCWKQALDRLHNGCRSLTDDVQARMALAFASCFLIKSGLKGYNCPEDSEVSECLQGVDNNAFTAYSNFFTHTQNMCQFLQAQVWREKTEGTILSLSESSAKVSESLQQSSQIQDTIVKNQIETLEYQKQIIANGSVLSQAIELSKSNVKEMLNEFRTSTDEQRMLIFSIFDRVAKLQNLVISEVSWIYTMLFYGVAMLILYLVTATRRTAEARLPIFIILTLNFCMERMICSWTLPNESEFIDEVPELINDRVWLLRKTSLLVSFIILSYIASTFKDYNLINHKLLQDICKQNRELSQTINIIKKMQLANDHTDFAIVPHQDFSKSLCTTDVTLENDSDCESDANSFDSTMTDRTWNSNDASDSESLVDEEDIEDDNVVEDFSFLGGGFFTAVNNSPTDSVNTTPTNKDSNENTIDNNSNGLDPPVSVISDEVSVQPMKVRKPRISKRGSDIGSRPNTPVHKYNLRRRAHLPIFENPILDAESPNSFGKLVSQLSHIAQKNSLLIRDKFQQLRRGEDSSISPAPLCVFSSDED